MNWGLESSLMARMKLNQAKRDRHNWIVMLIMHCVCVVLNFACVVLYAISLASAIATGAALGLAIVRVVAWFIATAIWTVLAIFDGRELKKANQRIKDLQENI